MSLYGVIGYHVTLSEGHMIANHPIFGSDWLSCDPLRGSHDNQSPHIRKHLCPIRGNFDLFLTNLFILYKGW